MQLNYIQKSKMYLIGTLGLLFSLTSCGSFQYAGHEHDSIYGTSERTVEYQEVTSNKNSSSQNSTYYQNYFKEKSQELDYLSQEDVIFTDIDSYEGDYEAENDTLNYPASYAGWGQNTTEVSINVLGGFAGYNYGYGGFYDPFYYDPFYYGYGGYGYGGFGHGGFGYGGYYGYGFGFPYYGYGYGHGYPYYSYGGYYGNNYYGGRGVSYNTGRRGSVYLNSNTSRLLNRRSSYTNSRNTSTTFRPRRTSTVRTSNTLTRPRTTTRRNINTRTRPNTRSTTTRRSSTRSYSPSRRSSTRSSSPSRSSTRSTSTSRSSRSSTSRRGHNL